MMLDFLPLLAALDGPVDLARVLPDAGSTYAERHDWLFWYITWFSIFFTVLIGSLVVIFVLRFRQRDPAKVAFGATHSTLLEVGWTIIPALFLIPMFLVGFRGYLDMTEPPSNAYNIDVLAKQWGWEFTYPNGAKSYQELHLPGNTPVRFTLRSADVIHSFYIPSFRIKKDCVPGRYNQTWVKPTIPEDLGDDESIEYKLFCTEYCGTGHSQMNVRVFVHNPFAFAAKLEELRAPPTDMPLAELGQKIYQQRGCNTCHSVDGSVKIGPTWKDLWGKPSGEHRMADGSTVEVDANYLRESIEYPARRIVQGYANQMQAYQLEEYEYEALFAYMKSISTHYQGSDDALQQSLGEWQKLQEGSSEGDASP